MSFVYIVAAASAIAPGTYTNEEEVYFAQDAGKAAAAWTSVEISENDVRAVDAYGSPAGRAPKISNATADSVTATLAGGATTVLRRARPVTCWGSVPKATRKPDGSEDWLFVRDLKLHDQGGRASFGGGTTGAKPVVLRMRNVRWPSGPNRPSLVLYVHTPDQPDHAISYSWADPEAKRIGINLRWMQASCTIENGEAK